MKKLLLILMLGVVMSAQSFDDYLRGDNAKEFIDEYKETIKKVKNENRDFRNRLCKV